MKTAKEYVSMYHDLLKTLIESTGIYSVDDGIVIDLVDGTPIFITDDERPIQLFNVPYSKENILLNPINETVTETKVTKWFYTLLVISVGMKIKEIIRYLISLIDIQDDLSINSLKELSKYLELIDNKKTPKEIDLITKNYPDFVNIFYNRRKREAYFRTGIFENSFTNKFNKNVRKKTIKFIDLLMCNIFDIDHNLEVKDKKEKLKEKLYYKTEEITCPKFECIINVYVKVLEYFNRIYDKIELEEKIFPTEEMKEYLEDLNEFYKISKWANSVSGSKESNQTTETKSYQLPCSSPTEANRFSLPGIIIPNVDNQQIIPTTSPSIIRPNVIQPTIGITSQGGFKLPGL